MSDDVRLPVPSVVEWPIFPFEGDFRVRKIEPPHDTERLRHGDPGGPPRSKRKNPLEILKSRDSDAEADTVKQLFPTHGLGFCHALFYIICNITVEEWE